MNLIRRLVFNAGWRRPRHTVCNSVPRAMQALHTARELRFRDRNDKGKEPPHSTGNARKADDNVDTLDLDAIFGMLDLPRRASQPPALGGTRDRRTVEGSTAHPSGGSDEDPDLADLLSAIDKNPANHGSSERPAASGNKSQRGKADPMAEFERILSDLAANDTEVYKRNRPAPLFWNEGGDSESGQNMANGRRAKFIDDLEPESLFEAGPRSSAFSAGSLKSDPRRISGTASRVLKLSADAKRAQACQTAQPHTGSWAGEEEPGMTGRRQTRREMDIEQAQLSRLSQCHSVAVLSSIIYSQLISAKASPGARPSPLVFTEAIRVARELQSPRTAYFVYNYCRTRLSLMDKLNVLNAAFYEELLATAWVSLRDISAVVSIIQDAVSLGVICDDRLDAQISLIIIELHKIYDLPGTANQIAELKSKLSVEKDSRGAVPLIARKAESTKSLYSL
ncbi:hypothetical protein GGI20_004425 [Coemansia sp. BCRC 34301]|nr:hypothetical protein GGI20_004425 [Coemansia sp. BCRC 34301]